MRPTSPPRRPSRLAALIGRAASSFDELSAEELNEARAALQFARVEGARVMRDHLALVLANASPTLTTSQRVAIVEGADPAAVVGGGS